MKQKYTVEVADIQYTLLSDDPEEFVNSVVTVIDERIREMIVKNKRCSKLDAAVLCAIDYCGSNMQAQKRIKNLEAQVALYAANVERLRDECDILSGKKATLPATAQADENTLPEEAFEPDEMHGEKVKNETDAEENAADEADKPADTASEEAVADDESDNDDGSATHQMPTQDDVRRRLDDFRNQLKNRREG